MVARNSRPSACDTDDAVAVVVVLNVYYYCCLNYYLSHSLGDHPMRMAFSVFSTSHADGDAADAVAIDSVRPIDSFVRVPHTIYDYDSDVRYFHPNPPLRNR